MNKDEIRSLENIAHRAFQPIADLPQCLDGHVLLAKLHAVQRRGAGSYLPSELFVCKSASFFSQECPQLPFKLPSHGYILTLNKFHIRNILFTEFPYME